MPSPLQSKPLNERSVAELQDCCRQELARYRRRTEPQESLCCLEIVRRAATAADDDAFAALLIIARPTIQKRCPPALRTELDEIAQVVAMRLFQRFHRAKQPFQVTTFAAYMVYLHLTCVSAVREVRTQQQRGESLEQLREMSGFEPATPLPGDEVERRMLLERWLELLPTPLQREAFRRKFAVGETPDGIAQGMDITKKEVYRLIEQAIRYLKALPEVRDMLEG